MLDNNVFMKECKKGNNFCKLKLCKLYCKDDGHSSYIHIHIHHQHQHQYQLIIIIIIIIICISTLNTNMFCNRSH